MLVARPTTEVWARPGWARSSSAAVRAGASRVATVEWLLTEATYTKSSRNCLRVGWGWELVVGGWGRG